MKQIFKLAFRNLFRNTRRTFLTTLLIGLSLAALMFTDALMLGMTKTMVNAATQIWSGEVQVHHQDYSLNHDVEFTINNLQEIINTLDKDPKVLVHSQRLISGGMISSSQNVSTALIYGVEPNKEKHLSKVMQALVQGKLLNANEESGIMIGKKMAELLEVELGDRLVLTSSQANSGELSQVLFRLAGIYEFGIREIDEYMVLVNLESARKLLDLPNQSHEIVLRFTEPNLAKDPSLPLLKALGKDGNLAENWTKFNSEISDIIKFSHYSIWILGAILFTLAALGILNSIFMSIHERTYEFGVIRAIGTSATQLFFTIIFEAFLIAVFSIVLGCIIGGLINYTVSITGLYMGAIEFSGVSFNDPIKTVITPRQFIDYPFWIMIITLGTSIYPAIFAARLQPSEALRRAL